MPGAGPRRPVALPPHAAGVQAQLAHVAGDLVPHGLLAAADRARRAEPLPGGGPALEWARQFAVVLGLLPALGSAVYKGVLFSTRAQPGWPMPAGWGAISPTRRCCWAPWSCLSCRPAWGGRGRRPFSAPPWCCCSCSTWWRWGWLMAELRGSTFAQGRAPVGHGRRCGRRPGGFSRSTASVALSRPLRSSGSSISSYCQEQ